MKRTLMDAHKQLIAQIIVSFSAKAQPGFNRNPKYQAPLT